VKDRLSNISLASQVLLLEEDYSLILVQLNYLFGVFLMIIELILVKALQLKAFASIKYLLNLFTKSLLELFFLQNLSTGCIFQLGLYRL
jgi:hypothetical protein